MSMLYVCSFWLSKDQYCFFHVAETKHESQTCSRVHKPLKNVFKERMDLDSIQLVLKCRHITRLVSSSFYQPLLQYTSTKRLKIYGMFAVWKCATATCMSFPSFSAQIPNGLTHGNELKWLWSHAMLVCCCDCLRYSVRSPSSRTQPRTQSEDAICALALARRHGSDKTSLLNRVYPSCIVVLSTWDWVRSVNI
jgi:hypothetical protein